MTAPTLDLPLGGPADPLHALWLLTLADRVSHTTLCPNCTDDRAADPPFVLCTEGRRHANAEQRAYRAYRGDWMEHAR